MHAWGNERNFSTAACGKGIESLVVSFHARRDERRDLSRAANRTIERTNDRRSFVRAERNGTERNGTERNGTERNAMQCNDLRRQAAVSGHLEA